MCEYCTPIKSVECGSGKDCKKDGSFYLTLYKYSKASINCIESDGYERATDINNCPWCGRVLWEENKEEEMNNAN